LCVPCFDVVLCCVEKEISKAQKEAEKDARSFQYVSTGFSFGLGYSHDVAQSNHPSEIRRNVEESATTHVLERYIMGQCFQSPVSAPVVSSLAVIASKCVCVRRCFVSPASDGAGSPSLPFVLCSNAGFWVEDCFMYSYSKFTRNLMLSVCFCGLTTKLSM
jgi:hypothetical protein